MRRARSAFLARRPLSESALDILCVAIRDAGRCLQQVPCAFPQPIRRLTTPTCLYNMPQEAVASVEHCRPQFDCGPASDFPVLIDIHAAVCHATFPVTQAVSCFAASAQISAQAHVASQIPRHATRNERSSCWQVHGTAQSSAARGIRPRGPMTPGGHPTTSEPAAEAN